MGEPEDDKLSIDRLDVNGDYSPENCRWATSQEQGQNQTSTKLTAQLVKTARNLCRTELEKKRVWLYMGKPCSYGAFIQAVNGKTWANI